MRGAGPPFDLAVVGCGAAGLMAAIQAGRAGAGRVVALDSAAKLGAKILVSGGGRCNVTHHAVDEAAFSGSTPPAIRNVLRRFGVPETIRFFEERGVRLKREETGKLFPVTDRARTVLDALVDAAREAGVEMRHPWRVLDIAREEDRFRLRGPSGEVEAARVVLATGGRSLPKSGSDGHGYELARRLGHTTTSAILPGLVPLVLAERCFIRRLSGITVEATLTLRASGGKVLTSFTGSTLCTHFGLSGPPVLDISRHWLHARLTDPRAGLFIDWAPGRGESGVRDELQRRPGIAVGNVLSGLLPDRLADALCVEANVDRAISFERLARDARSALLSAVCAYPLPVTGDRGFTYAEVTAGGVPLSQVNLKSLESRTCSGLYLVGEILDVDGRIGGFNFQWAWASGFVAGTSVPYSLSGGRIPEASR